MKKVVDINIGGMNFTMEDDAFITLRNYLAKFESTISNPEDVKEVMEDIESRVAEIFQKELKSSTQVVDAKMVDKVIDHLGKIDDYQEPASEKQFEEPNYTEASGAGKRFYRDPDDKKIAGVCSGVAHYFNVDVTLIRIAFLIALVCYGTGIGLYLILWIALPEAMTVPQKLEMRGIPVTAENIRKYSSAFGK